MYIYKVTNIINNKIYIGQTHYKIEKRLSGHFRETRSAKKKNNYFHNAIKKHGEQNFFIEEIDTAMTIDELNAKEVYWIEILNSTNRNIGYNLMSGGKSGLKSTDTKNKSELLQRSGGKIMKPQKICYKD